MLTFFDYLRQRAFEAVIAGVNDAFEYLDSHKTFNHPKLSQSQLPSVAKANQDDSPSKATTPSASASPHEFNGSTAFAKSEKPLPPRKRGRPRKSGWSQIMSDREKEILRVVCNCVRVLSTDQVARTWWSDTRWGSCRAKEALWDLAARDWLCMQPVLARPIQPLRRPLLVWEAGNAIPPFEDLSRQLGERARSQPVVTTIVYATSKAVSLFGRGWQTHGQRLLR